MEKYFETQILNSSKVYCKAIESDTQDRLNICMVHSGREPYIRMVKGIEKTFLKGSKELSAEDWQKQFNQVIESLL